MRRGTPAGDEEVEESIEFAHDDDDGSSPSSISLTRHTRSHYDLHSRKGGVTSARHTSQHSTQRVPLQPRVSTPPCAAASGAGTSASWIGGVGGRSCSCLGSSASPAASVHSGGMHSSRRARQPQQPTRELRVGPGVSPSRVADGTRIFSQLPASPVRKLRSGDGLGQVPASPEEALGYDCSLPTSPYMPSSPCVPGSPALGLGYDDMADGGFGGFMPPEDGRDSRGSGS